MGRPNYLLCHISDRSRYQKPNTRFGNTGISKIVNERRCERDIICKLCIVQVLKSVCKFIDKACHCQ